LLPACVVNAPLHDPDYAPAEMQAITPPPVKNGGLYQQSHSMALFQDIKAYRVGDLVTVMLAEKIDASKSAKTSTSKENDIGIAQPTLLGRSLNRGKLNLSADLQSSQSFKGEGDSNQSNSISGSITVMVTGILPNGYLKVRGEKAITINRGDEFVRLSGIIRPVDITPANTVSSTQVGNARIIYSGRGAVADSNAHGWLSRFFLSKLWPF